MRVCLAAIFACSLGGLAMAEPGQRVSTASLDRSPEALIGRQIRVAKLGCFSTPDAGYRCTTYSGAYVLLGTVTPAATKARIDAECGGIVEAEDDPSCLFDVAFTPLSASKGDGDIVKGDRSVRGPVWMIRAATGTATLHR